MQSDWTLSGHLQLQQGDFQLDSGEFALPLQGVTVLFGRSGSGKSTLLRALSGLDKHTQGQLKFGEQVWQEGQTRLLTQKRDIGFVFQDAALFPHLTVRQNLLYGVKRLPKGVTPADFELMVQRVGIADQLDRAVTNLSGGEKQRVAIARALLMRPKLLCMDEPLSALDWRAKSEMLNLIESLVESYQLPVLYITHSPDEVARLADTVVFMDAGKIQGVEPIEQALNRPDTPLYQQAEPRSVLSAKVLAHLEEEGLTQLQAGQETLFVPQITQSVATDVRVMIAAQQVSLMAQKPEITSMLNHLDVVIEAIEPHNDYSHLLRLKLAKEPWPLLAQVTKRSAKQLDLQVGQHWVAAIKSVSLLN